MPLFSFTELKDEGVRRLMQDVRECVCALNVFRSANICQRGWWSNNVQPDITKTLYDQGSISITSLAVHITVSGREIVSHYERNYLRRRWDPDKEA